MATPNLPPDPPPSISAAELRRRLLASTPPPIAATASTPDPGDQGMADHAPSTWANHSSQDLLSRLRMPGGKSGSIPVPPSRSVYASPSPGSSPESTSSGRTPVNRRTPAPSRASGLDPASAIAGALNQLAGLGDSGGRVPVDDSPLAEIQRLRGENKELRTLLDEMKHLLQEASDGEQQYTIKEKEYLAALESKDGQIEELSAQLGAIEDQIAKGDLAPPPPTPKTRSELEEMADELEKESAKLNQDRKRIDDDRRQLREDEEALEKQMRDMEVAMARERAILARQETELKRLSAEIQHELDLLQRGDATLREQMAKFQRRAQDVMTKPGQGGGGRR
jgi:hypothetical protein